MKNARWCSFFLCTSAFAQSATDNAARDALRKRVLGMNLLNPTHPKPIVIAGPVTQTKVCSIPLLRAIPPGTSDTMRIVKPKDAVGETSRGGIVRVPAPPCNETLFTNK
jgi:hypothetical protein